MKLSFLISLLVIALTINSNALAEVSDVKLEAMEGESVSLTIDAGEKLEINIDGELTKVSSQSIVIVAKNGEVNEIPKTKIMSIRKSKIERTSREQVMCPGAPFALNLFLGFGIGSYMQGDKMGGRTGLIWDLSSYALFGIGIMISVGQLSYGYSVGASTTATVLLITSGISILSSRMYQLTRPFSYYRKSIALLESIYLLPDIAYSGDVSGIKVGLRHNFKF